MMNFCLSLLVSLATYSHEKPSSERTGAISLDSTVSGSAVHLAVTIAEKDKRELHYVRSADSGATWEKPLKIPPFAAVHSPDRGSFPQIAAFGKRILVVWIVPAKTKFGGGRFASAISEDQGKTWFKGGELIDDPKIESGGFLDIIADSTGFLHATWLDTRDGIQGLRYARSRDFGKTWAKNITVNAKTCECCYNRIYAFSPESVQIFYRSFEPRDMSVAESKNNGQSFTDLGTVGKFDWQIKACPHMGGALTSADMWRALVWTGKKESMGLHQLSSEDEGKTWSAPLQVGSRYASQGDLASTSRSTAIVWKDSDDGKPGEKIKAQYTIDAGGKWSDPQTFSKPGTSSNSPQIHAMGHQYLVVWLTQNGSRSSWESKVWKPE